MIFFRSVYENQLKKLIDIIEGIVYIYQPWDNGLLTMWDFKCLWYSSNSFCLFGTSFFTLWLA